MWRIGDKVKIRGRVDSILVDREETPEGECIEPNSLKIARREGRPVSTIQRDAFRVLQKVQTTEDCLVLGWSYRHVGKIIVDGPGSPFDPPSIDPPHLFVEERVKVWIVQPLARNNRYRSPMAVLSEQIDGLIHTPEDDDYAE